MIGVIRENDPNNIILVGNPHWDQDLHLVAEDPIQNATNIMYTMHFYAATHDKWLRDRTDAAIAKGIPVFCLGMWSIGGEWRRTFGNRRMKNVCGMDGKPKTELGCMVGFRQKRNLFNAFA